VGVGDGEGNGLEVGVAVGARVGVVGVGGTGVSVGRTVGVAEGVPVGRGVSVGGWTVDVGDCTVAVGGERVGVGGEMSAQAVMIRSARAAVTVGQRWFRRRRWRSAPVPDVSDMVIRIIPWNWEDLQVLGADAGDACR
jgi:hypothetical protein